MKSNEIESQKPQAYIFSKKQPVVIDKIIVSFSGLRELFSLLVVNKHFKKLIESLAKRILIQYFEQQRGAPFKIIPKSFSIKPLSVASQLLSHSLFRNGSTLKVGENEENSFQKLVCFHPDASQFITISGKNLRMWGLDKENKWRTSFNIEVENFVTAISFSPDGTYCVIALGDNTLKICRPVSTTPNDVSLQASATLQAHTGRVNAIAHNPKGGEFATVSSDNTCCIWKESDNKEWQVSQVIGIYSSVLSVSYRFDGGSIVLGTAVGLKIFSQDDQNNWVQTQRLSLGVNRWNELIGVFFFAQSPDGKYLVTQAPSTRNGRGCLVWSQSENGWQSTLLRHESLVTAISYNPNGRNFVTGSSNGTCQIWSLSQEGWKSLAKTQCHQGKVASITHNPVGSFFVMAPETGSYKALPCHINNEPNKKMETLMNPSLYSEQGESNTGYGCHCIVS